MTINLPTLRCSKCLHEWNPRKLVLSMCPKCKRKGTVVVKEVKLK